MLNLYALISSKVQLMTTQSSLWQAEHVSSSYAELCNALYERELRVLTQAQFEQANVLQLRLKSLPHYIRRTAHSMSQVAIKDESPLVLDVQNAAWTCKQSSKSLLDNYHSESVKQWFSHRQVVVGLVVAIGFPDKVVLDCIDRVDSDNQRFRTNINGWFKIDALDESADKGVLLKPSKRVFIAACAGHRWRSAAKTTPQMLSLRELLLSCQINWRNFRKPLSLT